MTPSCAVDPALRPIPCIPTDQGGGLLTNQLAAGGPPRHRRLGQARLPGGHARADRRHHLLRDDPQRVRRAVPGARGLRARDPGRHRLPRGPRPGRARQHRRRRHRQRVRHRPLAAAQREPGPAGSRATRSRRTATRSATSPATTSRTRSTPTIGPNCLEVPLDRASRPRTAPSTAATPSPNYCPERLQPRRASDCNLTTRLPRRPPARGGRLHRRTRSCRRTPPTPARATPAARREPARHRAHGRRPRWRRRLPLPHRPRGGRQRRPRQPVRAAIPPPPCTGDDHVIDQATLTPRSNYFRYAGAHAPLCDKQLVVLNNRPERQRRLQPDDQLPDRPERRERQRHPTGDVAEPGRVVGQVFNDIYFERNPKSNWYGEPRPIASIPVGIYARVDTCRNVNQPFDAQQLAADHDGEHERRTARTRRCCPRPRRSTARSRRDPCPGMYIVTVDDPGTKTHPNPNYNPNLLTANTPFEVWPGLTDQLDTPLDPISGTACEDPAERRRSARPSIPPGPSCCRSPRRWCRPDRAAGRSRSRATSSAPPVRPGQPAAGVTLTDVRTGAGHDLDPGQRRHRRAGLRETAEHPDTIVIKVPGASSRRTFRPGPKQLDDHHGEHDPGGGGVSSVNGITMHVLGPTGRANAVTYNPPVVNVPPPPPGPGRARTPFRTRSTPRRPAACWCCRPAPTTRTSSSGSR